MKDIKVTNPELQRNIWIELSPNRLILMPIIILVVVLLIYLVKKDNPDCATLIGHYALLGYGILVMFWGSKLAADSVIDEVNNHTWDTQKLTRISPRQMAIGKLFGSTIYQWYGGIICLAIYLLSGIVSGKAEVAFQVSLLYILAGIFVHAMTIVMSLQGMRKYRDKAKINSTIYFLLSLILAGYISSYINP